MYPVFIAAFFTAIDTIVFIIVLPKSVPDDAFYFFITNMIAGFCDFTLKLSVMIAYYLIIKHVYMKLDQAKWVGQRGDSRVGNFKIANFDEIPTSGTKTNRTSINSE